MLSLFVLLPEAASAATFYVSTSGSDTNPGTSAQPFRTLQKGVSLLKPSDTLLVGPGTYAESLHASIPGGTSWSAAVTLRALDAANRPVIRPAAGTQRVLHFQGGQQYIIVDGFVLDGVNITYDTIKITAGGGGVGHHIRVMNCEIKNAKNGGVGIRQQGVLTTDGAGFNEFINNDVYENGSDDFMHGLYIATSNNLIKSNRVYRNAGWGVHVYSDSGGVNDNVVSENIVYDNARVGNRGNGIILSSGSRNVAFNNVVWNNNGGIVVDIGAIDSQVLNNSVVNNRNVGISISGSTGATIRNNIAYQNSLNAGGSQTVSANNLVGTNPMFINAATFNFRIQSSSPAVDAATTVPMVTADADGQARPYGGAPDIGAYEFRSGTGAPTAPVNLRIIR